MNSEFTNIERVLGKINNDFNSASSDWIPRCAAWCIDALSQLNCLPVETRRKKIEVKDKIGYFYCLNGRPIKVIDENGCTIPEFNGSKTGCCGSNSNKTNNLKEIQIGYVSDNYNDREIVSQVVNSSGRNYVVVGDTIELNFETDYIFVEYPEVQTEYSQTYQCDVPKIINDGNLIEALAWYCMYKLLLRGEKHQVLSLSGHPGINPYLQWMETKKTAKTSVILKLQQHHGDGEWANYFYNFTFLPRRN